MKYFCCFPAVSPLNQCFIEIQVMELTINRLDQLVRIIFLWKMGLESMRFDGIEDIMAVLETITRELRLIQENLRDAK